MEEATIPFSPVASRSVRMVSPFSLKGRHTPSSVGPSGVDAEEGPLGVLGVTSGGLGVLLPQAAREMAIAPARSTESIFFILMDSISFHSFYLRPAVRQGTRGSLPATEIR